MEDRFDRLTRRLIRKGPLTVQYPSGREETYGSADLDPVAIRIADADALKAMLRDPTIAVGEMYMQDRLQLVEGDIYGYISMVKRNASILGATPEAVALHFWRTVAANVRWPAGVRNARRNISHHYDLDERLFRLFLDEDMNYSCAYYEYDGQSLEDAQRAKQRHIASKLLSKPGSRALDIGSGWGGMGMYLAGVCGLDVTGVTLSTEQQRVATERAAERGLDGKVRFELRDYRQVQGQFDHIVSIGMLEHVGLPQLKTYFSTVAKLLDKNGTALIHSMARTKPAAYSQPFGEKYIFPGGYIPALSEMVRAIEAAGLLIKDVEILPLHYAETTREWRRRFLANRERVLEIFDDKFLRMWEIYLAASEASFRHDRIHVVHLQLARHQDRVPIRRGWIDDEKDRLRAAEVEAGFAPVAEKRGRATA